MYALIVGVLLSALKLAGLEPFANWSWWIVLSPFAVAALWWQFADSTGLTKRREIDKLEQRKQDRRAKTLEALGIDHQRDRQARKAREAAQRRNEMTERRDEARDQAPPRKEPRP